MRLILFLCDPGIVGSATKCFSEFPAIAETCTSCTMYLFQVLPLVKFCQLNVETGKLLILGCLERHSLNNVKYKLWISFFFFLTYIDVCYTFLINHRNVDCKATLVE